MASGIIAEYNPFHNGHVYHISQTKLQSGAPVVVVLSGDFVQRGEVALYSKHIRTRHALENSAAMVLQLPTVFSLSSAQRFAKGAIDILALSGIVDTVSFGSECGDLPALIKASEAVESEEYVSRLRALLSSGVSYPRAISEAAGDVFSFGSNDILAMEYLRSLRPFKDTLSPLCVFRKGALHDSAPIDRSFASAGFIRKAVLEDQVKSIESFVPTNVYRSLCELTPRKEQNLSSAILYALRRMSLEELAKLPDVCEGLENVLYKQARACADYHSFLFACKTKRYTLARLRRISMCALLGITENDLDIAPYIRVLGIRKEAQGLLAQLCKKSALPVVVRYADLSSLPAPARRLSEIDTTASEIACMAENSPARFDYAEPLILV